MSNVLMFPRSQIATDFHESSRREIAEMNREFKNFTSQELVQISHLTAQPLACGLITDYLHFQSIDGTIIQGIHAQNPADVKFILNKYVPEKDYTKYYGYIPLLNEKIVFDTWNSANAFQQLRAGLREACYEYQILNEPPSIAPQKFIQS